MDLLARREHATDEIRKKLVGRGIDAALADATVEKLNAEGLLSDQRFIEAFVQSRKNRGYGPLHIRAELRQRGIGDELISHYIDARDEFWADHILAVWRKRFGDHPPRDIRERARQTRFLQYRGFTSEQISHLFKHPES